MGLLSFITGADRAGKVIDKVGDGLVKGLDMLVLTDEERLQYSANAGKQWLEVQQVLAQENTARTLTRRYIAVAIIYSWLIMILATFCLALWEVLKKGALTNSMALFTIIGTVMGTTVIAIIVFYFGPTGISKILGKDK